MTNLVNSTRGAAGWTVRYGLDAEERLVLALRTTWDIKPDGRLVAIEKEPDLLLVDEYRDEPATSSLLREAELAPAKPGTDVAVIGRAVARGRDVKQMQVSLSCTGLPTNTLWVFGERKWNKRLMGHALSESEPFESCDLAWELAAGGVDEKSAPPVNEPRNPVGRGLRGTKSKTALEETAVPRITAGEDDLVTPAGWGFVAPNWAPRVDYAGTYDKAWQEDRFPLLPEDFDPRFFQTGAPGLTSSEPLQGPLQVRVRGCHRDGDLSFTVPAFEVTATIRIQKADDMACPLGLATVLIEPNDRRVSLLWRGEVNIHRRLERMQEMALTATGEGIGVKP